MKRLIFIAALTVFLGGNLYGGLLINEIACGTSGDDWVELFFNGQDGKSMNISGLYVTMYYGENEPLSAEPVTIYSYDRPVTPYDDRFAVVHLTDAYTPDETDKTGDTNRNGYIDIYCNNYSSSLWNTNCVVAIDTDDDPSNGGIIDFAAYTNMDGSLNDTIRSYVESAQNRSEWQRSSGSDFPDCMIDIGKDGLSAYTSISRKNTPDTNSPGDFEVTKYMTPGRENILQGSRTSGGRLIKSKRKSFTFIPSCPEYGDGNIDLFVYEQCCIRLRIFTSTGMMIYESPLYRDVNPGNFTVKWDLRGKGKRARTGLYIGHIEATSRKLRKTESKKIYVILSRYR